MAREREIARLEKTQSKKQLEQELLREEAETKAREEQMKAEAEAEKQARWAAKARNRSAEAALAGS